MSPEDQIFRSPLAYVLHTRQSLEQKLVVPYFVQIHWYQLPPYDFLQSPGSQPLASKLGHQPLGLHIGDGP